MILEICLKAQSDSDGLLVESEEVVLYWPVQAISREWNCGKEYRCYHLGVIGLGSPVAEVGEPISSASLIRRCEEGCSASYTLHLDHEPRFTPDGVDRYHVLQVYGVRPLDRFPEDVQPLL